MARGPFARRLKELRKAAGLSQYALAKKSGLTKQAIAYLESLDREPTWNTVRLLARALGVTCEAFDIGDPEGMPKPSGEKKPRKGE